ncbi:PAS domain-containing protein [Cellulomonas sp. ATA003]|uniref:PAS domain-containing protein n=1 Tax=Cellulomonas sp. ATA003 TaxID=3073064 RepID=UPI0028739B93|nr:PAS domain-containing protein [Cellulomonas sp. ATA003]WNB86654.1 PAS domain-containing protein [Cellulomonas sp. ATA003]
MVHRGRRSAGAQRGGPPARLGRGRLGPGARRRRPSPVDEPGAGATVRLLALPTTLWFAARQHHDDLLRELTLHATRHPRTGLDLVAADHARAVLSAAVAAAVDGLRAGEQRVGGLADAGESAEAPSGASSTVVTDAATDAVTDAATDAAPGERGWDPVPIDLTLEVPATMIGDFEALQDALDTAEDLARAGELLARPGLAEVIAVRDWACEQVVAQLAGIPPAAWPGLDDVPDADRVAGHGAATTAGPVQAVVERVRTSDHGVAAADDTNRIVAVSEPLAHLLGWSVDDLVGRRIVAIVPARLREAHVAGFTRHQSTGEARILGVPLTVPVLRSDGTQVTCHLLIESVEHGAGGSLYLAWIGPATEPAPAVTPDARPCAEPAPA